MPKTDSHELHSETMFRSATEADLPMLSVIHKVAYSKRHFTSLLAESTLTKYYGYFLGDGVETCLATDQDVGEACSGSVAGTIQGFAVYGTDISSRITLFKRDCFREIFLASMKHPFSAFKKIVNTVFARVTRPKIEHIPAEFLLLSIAVATPGFGIGRKLIDHMIGRARERRHQKVGLYVNADNIGAINVYFLSGFSIKKYRAGQYYMELEIPVV